MGTSAPEMFVIDGIELPIWKGLAYRAPSGYFGGGTAASEAEDFLDQQAQNAREEPWYETLRAMIPYLRRVDALDMYWVTKKKKDAEQYEELHGSPIETLRHLDGKAVILGEDDEGGYLIVEDSGFIVAPEMGGNTYMGAPRNPRTPIVMTGNRWEAQVSGDRTLTDLIDRKSGKRTGLLTLEDVREMKELVQKLESTMEERR